MLVMYSYKNRQYTVKAPDGIAVQLCSKRNLHLNGASASHFHNNNKAGALLPMTSVEKCHILIPFLLDKTRVRLQDIFSTSAKYSSSETTYR